AFPYGIRINATDKLEGGLTQNEAVEVVRLLDKSTVDLIDVSGGTYFPGAPSSSDNAATSGPYFVEFGKRAKAVTSIPIMVTGGFKTCEEALVAMSAGAADEIGLARAMALNPSLANSWLSDAGCDPDHPRFAQTVPGGVTAWYSMRLTALGEDREGAFDQDLPAALQDDDARDARRCVSWRARLA
ncbi:MAG: oxidoreductase, partial [Brevirhabdus sp.]